MQGALPGWGPLKCQGGYQARPKIHVIRVFFRTRHCTRVHRLGMQKHAKLEKRGIYGHIGKFWKEHDRQIKKNECKNAYLGSFFIPE